MTDKINPYAAAPQLMKSWTALSTAVADSLEPSLIELVKIRSSQINGCANCINMHTYEAREKGETEQRTHQPDKTVLGHDHFVRHEWHDACSRVLERPELLHGKGSEREGERMPLSRQENKRSRERFGPPLLLFPV